MDQNNLDMARQDIDEALKLIEDMEAALTAEESPKEIIKEKFSFLSKKVQELEDLLRSEGII
ncbi:MAG TPA: hypothetical protein DGK91_08080 [Clostridium sp.]|jgi:hypothetical protein|nr:hypothetical protein [Clostridia bacterium]HCW04475.1 hypothetical protein [Clostridium sp.]